MGTDRGSLSGPLKVAVVGVGHLGRHHARILSTLDGVSLTAVVDKIPDRAAEIAASTGTRALADCGELLGAVDAVTVAVPTELHHAIAMPFLERGTSVLVEKPMARSLAEADEMIAAAKASGATLAVGHTERYNPAVAAVFPLVTSPRFIEVHRLGVFPERSLDIDVVFDLMIHDLDVILSAGPLGRDVGRGCRRAGPDAEVRHCQRAIAVRVGMHRQRDREPDQQGSRQEDPVLSARRLPVDRLCGPGGGGLAIGQTRWSETLDRGRAGSR